jgi:hypothetical protein
MGEEEGISNTKLKISSIRSKRSKAILLCHAGAKVERQYSSNSFLTSALDGVSGQCHNLAVHSPRERTSNTHWIGGWVGLRAEWFMEP